MVTDTHQLVQKQKKFFQQGKTKAIDFRLQMLKQLQQLIRNNEMQFAEALRKDLGKSAFEAYATEIGIVLEEIAVFLKKTKKWANKRHVNDPVASFPSRSFIMPEPHGVSLIISPWNYPFQLAIAPMVAAIAAGNCVILKPSELSIHTSELIKNLINSTFDEEYIHVVTGDASKSQALLIEPVDMIFFTGSPKIGKLIMKAAAELLVPVVLELGGKSPVIVDKSTNIKLTAKRIMWGKSINAGQTCIAPDYVLAEESIVDQLIEAMKEAAAEMFGADAETNPEYPRIINEANMVRLNELINDTNIVFGSEGKVQNRFFPLTIVKEPSSMTALMEEEIFGPILPVLSFKTAGQAVGMINSKPKPLAMYVFSSDKAFVNKFLNEVSAGGVTVNDTIMHFTNGALPFGGAGFSGIGSYHGESGFNAFSHMKAVMKRATWLDIPLRYPPFGNKLKLVKLILR